MGGGGGRGHFKEKQASPANQKITVDNNGGGRYLSGLFSRYLHPVPEPPTHRGYRYGKQGLEFLENHSFRLVAVPTELRGFDAPPPDVASRLRTTSKPQIRSFRVCIASMFTSPLGVFLRSCESPFPEKNLILGMRTPTMPGPTSGSAPCSVCPWKRTGDKS